MAKFGFVGLGRMGIEMAGNLLKAGHEVSVFNRTIEKADSLKKLGRRCCPCLYGDHKRRTSA